MGGGNAQKSKTKRDRANVKKAKEMKQKNRSKEPPKYRVCQFCRQQFNFTVQEDALQEHVVSDKHKKSTKTFAECFPDFKAPDDDAAPVKPAWQQYEEYEEPVESYEGGADAGSPPVKADDQN